MGGNRATIRFPHLPALALFVALAVVHTWPLALRPGVNSRIDNADYTLNAWAIHWIARTLPTSPANVFHAPIFHPHPYALAYSEPLLLPGALAIPVVWTGGSAVLAINLLTLAGYALTGWAFAWYVHRLTGSVGAGLVGGSLVAFAAQNLMRLAQLQALHLELVPLVFVALDGLLERRRPRHAIALGAALAAQATISIYLLIFTAWALVCAALARWREWIGRGHGRAAGLLAAAAVASVVFAAPVLWPYLVLRQGNGFERTVEQAQRYASTWADYLYTGSRLHYDLWSRRFDEAEEANFPGLTCLVLATVALAAGWRSGHVRMWTAVAAGAVLLSVAPFLPGFAALHDVVPGLGAIRVYARAGQMALVALGILGGIGAARALSRLPGSRARLLATAALLLLVNGEALRAPLPYTDFNGIPAVYDVLAADPGAVVVELPFYPHRVFHGNAIYMLAATVHQKPLLNGYSGFAPRDFEQTATLLNELPSLEALEFLHRRGVTHVVVHRDHIGAKKREALDASEALTPVASDDAITLYRLRQ